MQPVVFPPATAQNQYVRIAVVVVVGLDNLQPADDPGQAGCCGPFCKGPIAEVGKIADLVVEAPRRGHDIQMAIAVEVVHDAAAGHGDQIQSQRRCHIGEALDIVVGDKNLGRDEPLRWHLFGVHAQGHIDDVQKPADG